MPDPTTIGSWYLGAAALGACLGIVAAVLSRIFQGRR
jgi:hypothetical protein